jgi:hypothetical protein
MAKSADCDELGSYILASNRWGRGPSVRQEASARSPQAAQRGRRSKRKPQTVLKVLTPNNPRHCDKAKTLPKAADA